MADWATCRGHSIEKVMAARGSFPSSRAFDALVLTGGPMGVHDEEQHPWLPAEVEFIRDVVRAGKRVLGICLGAQLVAHALGARVGPNRYREVG